MSEITNITLPSDEATPVNHIFVPLSNTDKLATWQDSYAGFDTVDEKPLLTLALRDGSANVKRRITTKIVHPYRPEDIGGETQALKNAEVFVTINIPTDCPLQVIKDITKFARSVSSYGTNFIEAIETGAHPL